MSCPNFERMNYGMPLVCGGVEYDASDFEDYEEYELLYEEDLDSATCYAKNINDSLELYEVKVIDGYWQGFQFQVEITNPDYDDYEDIDNESAKDYYGMCRSKLLQKAESERNKIKKFLLEIAADSCERFVELVCTGVFSNGDAIYEYASKRSA